MATAALAAQQATVARIQTNAAPLGAAAAAAALLLKPALNDFGHADALRLVAVVLGCFGLLCALASGILVLAGTNVDTFNPTTVESAAAAAELMSSAEKFDLTAAQLLNVTRENNGAAMTKLKAWFLLLAGGLVVEVLTLGTAAVLASATQLANNPPRPHRPNLRVASLRLDSGGTASIAWETNPAAHGRVHVRLLMRGVGTERIVLTPMIVNGTVIVETQGARHLRPVHSLRWTVVYRGSSTFAAATLSGQIVLSKACTERRRSTINRDRCRSEGRAAAGVHLRLWTSRS